MRGEVKGNVYRVMLKRLYLVFKEYAKQNYPNNKAISIENFTDQICECGLLCTGKRLKINNRSGLIVDVSRGRIAAHLRRLYPKKHFEGWEWEKDLTKFKRDIRNCTTQFD